MRGGPDATACRHAVPSVLPGPASCRTGLVEQGMSLDQNNFQGVNLGYVLDLYARYQRDPSSVDEKTRGFFRTWTPPLESAPERLPVTGIGAGGLDPRVIMGAVNLAESVRRYGHLAAEIDPLGSRPLGDPMLLPETHGITADELKALPATLAAGP